MDEILLSVEKLTKKYPAFTLSDVSFQVKKCEIVGFIGRNGAGKSTALKSMFGFVHPDNGNVSFFGLPFYGNENTIKQRVGFVSGGVDYYRKNKIRTITDVTRRFYPNWDESAYRDCLSRFSLDENKTPSELSAGMCVKYALALALSHRAELLCLDEPTSGLDPVSRDELLDIFLNLREQGIGILFSTHIVSDLERSADRILHIREGKIESDLPLSAYIQNWRFVKYTSRPPFADRLIGERRERDGFTALLSVNDLSAVSDTADCIVSPATLEEIMLHLERN